MNQPTNDQPDDHLDPQEDIVEQPSAQEAARGRALVGMFGGWGISAAIHVGAIALAAAAVFAAPKQDIETPPVRVNTIDPPKREQEQVKTERQLETQVKLDITTPTENEQVAPVTKLEVPTEVPQETETETVMPKGREEAVSDSETGGTGAFMAISAGGGGSAGMFGARTSATGKKIAITKGGGSKGAESAVNAALQWFKRHQSPNGAWDPLTYQNNCTEGAKCEPGTTGGHYKQEDVTVATTGYAVLCFLGAGYDHKTPNKYKTTVKRGIDYLLGVQKKGSGLLGSRNYEHGVAAMALAEAYAMTGDPELKDPTQRAINYMLSKQNQDTSKGGLGWDYVGPNKRNDSSVTGWQVMALKSALAGGLNVGNGMAGAKVWLEKSWRASNTANLVKLGAAFKDASQMTVKDKSRFAYVWTTGDDEVAVKGVELPPVKDPKTGKEIPQEHGHGIAAKVATAHGGAHSMECVGLVCGVFLGKTAGDVMMESLANTVMAHQVPTRYPCNTYYMYYNTLAIFQVGGERWRKWNASVRDMLVNSQRKTRDCFDGSWDWQGTVFPGSNVGRLLSTAYNTLCLEVYYRYAQVQKHK